MADSISGNAPFQTPDPVPELSGDTSWAPDAALTRAEWLPVLFAERPTRGTLLALRPSWPLDRVRVRVHRNVACELITSVADPYLTFAGIEAEWVLGEYDDSLGFAAAGDCDAELIWIDFSRFETEPERLAEWLLERLGHLRRAVRSPILITSDPREVPASLTVNAALARAAAALPGVYVCDLSITARQLSHAFFDARNARIIGLPYSNVASVLLARELGSRWLPGAVSSGLKAIVVDLDHTLYAGVLGEEGIADVRLEAGHLALQEQLVACRNRGIFLGVCSKNEPEDVDALFRTRTDFPLKAEHFSARAIGWTDKSLGLRRIAQQLRIGFDAILYIDDNPGELAAIAAGLPDLKLLHAGPDPAITLRALSDYPGLYQWRADDADTLRVADLEAAAERDRQADGSSDRREYLKTLNMRVRFRVDLPGDVERLHSLSSKTNQFNLSLKRLQASEVAEYVEGPHAHAVAVELADRLSDSGIIAAVFLRVKNERCFVEEVCVSCRALGRGLEDVLVLGAIQAACGDQPPLSIVFQYAKGPRNGPARQWLEQVYGRPLDEDAGTAVTPWPSCAERLDDLSDLVVAETTIRIQR